MRAFIVPHVTLGTTLGPHTSTQRSETNEQHPEGWGITHIYCIGIYWELETVYYHFRPSDNTVKAFIAPHGALDSTPGVKALYYLPTIIEHYPESLYTPSCGSGGNPRIL